MQLITKSGDLEPKWFHVALRAVSLMAESEVLLKSNTIAELVGEEPTFIRKILAKLAAAGIVKAYSGRYGGYSLTKDASEITIQDVYKAFDHNSETPHWSVPNTGTEQLFLWLFQKLKWNFSLFLGNIPLKILTIIEKNKIRFNELNKSKN